MIKPHMLLPDAEIYSYRLFTSYNVCTKHKLIIIIYMGLPTWSFKYSPCTVYMSLETTPNRCIYDDACVILPVILDFVKWSTFVFLSTKASITSHRVATCHQLVCCHCNVWQQWKLVCWHIELYKKGWNDIVFHENETKVTACHFYQKAEFYLIRAWELRHNVRRVRVWFIRMEPKYLQTVGYISTKSHE